MVCDFRKSARLNLKQLNLGELWQAGSRHKGFSLGPGLPLLQRGKILLYLLSMNEDSHSDFKKHGKLQLNDMKDLARC